MIDKIEIVSEFKHIQIRIANPLFDAQGKEVSKSFERKVLLCGDFEGAKAEGEEIEKLALVLWTEEIVQKFNADQENKKSIRNS